MLCTSCRTQLYVHHHSEQKINVSCKVDYCCFIHCRLVVLAQRAALYTHTHPHPHTTAKMFFLQQCVRQTAQRQTVLQRKTTALLANYRHALYIFTTTGSGSIIRKKTSNTQVLHKLRIGAVLLHDTSIYSIESVNQRKLLTVPGQPDNQAVHLICRDREGGGKERERNKTILLGFKRLMKLFSCLFPIKTSD